MPWAQLIDAAFWLILLVACVFLGMIVSRRRDLPGRMFLGMMAVLAVPLLLSLLAALANSFAGLTTAPEADRLAALLATTGPIRTAMFVLFSCLTLHLFLLFPVPSRFLRRYRWCPLLFYLSGLLLIVMSLSRLILSAGEYVSFWHLNILDLHEDVLPLAFNTLAVGLAALRLMRLFAASTNALTRQQLGWLLWGLGTSGVLVMATSYLPGTLGLPVPAAHVPGLQQLPILVMVAGIALSLLRSGQQVVDVDLVVNRSLVYGALATAVTLLYLLVASALPALFPLVSVGMRPFVAVLSTLIVVLLALPLRDWIQHRIDRLFMRSRPNYQHLLHEFSRTLTTSGTLPRVIATLADQVEEVFHPAGLAVVMANGTTALRVALSRGQLASSSQYGVDMIVDPHHFVATQLGDWRRPLYLSLHLDALPALHRAQWLSLQRSGAELFVPMHLRGNLNGWLVLGPRLAGVPYVQQDLEFLSSLADQSCVALDNVRLYNATQQRATELALVSMVSSAISSSLDLEHVLQTIVESVIQVVGCDKSALFELNEEGTELSLRTAKGLSQSYIENSLHLKVGRDPRVSATVTQQPMIVPDVELEPALASLQPLAHQEGYRGLVDLPLIGRQGLVGILTVYFDEVHTPAPGEIEILTTFASQAAVAIENARLFTAVRRERDRATRLYEQTDAALARRVEELTAVEEISRELAGTLSLETVIHRLLARALQLTRAHRGIIALYDRDQGSLRLLAQSGFPPEMERYRVESWPLDRGVIGRVARTGRLALLPDVTADPEYVGASENTASQLCIPIVHDRQVIGAITLESNDLAAFTAEHVRFVQLIAEHAAIAINNAQLFGQVTETRDRLQAILNSTRDAVIVMDTGGQVILTNPGVRALLGESAEEWLWLNHLAGPGVAALDDAAPAVSPDVESLLAAMHQVPDRPEEAVAIAANLDDAGRRRYVEGTATPVLSTDGQVLGRVAILRDVTSQNELEHFRDEMTRMLLHNLQGPLAAIISSLEMLRDDYGVVTDEPGELVRIALTSSRRLYIRLESLLKIRQLEEKRVPLDIQPAPLPHLVQPVIQEYLPIAVAGRVTLDADIPSDLPPVLVDEELIGRLFSNLLDNALKYTPAGGHIAIRAALDPYSEAPRLRCAVADTGPGISPDILDLIFEKYQRGARPTHTYRGGSGIGLHYCRLVIQAHGGTIWAESQVGHGSTFYFTLPVAVNGESAAHTQEVSPL